MKTLKTKGLGQDKKDFKLLKLNKHERFLQ